MIALKWITPDAGRMIVDCARVSSDPSADKRPDADLLRYLLRHKHFSPFEMASACFEITTTRDIGRQILRHRSFSFQEFSQRYQDVSVLPVAQYRDTRMQHPTRKQASLPCEDDTLHGWFIEQQREVLDTTYLPYREALKRGIAKEVARALLPEGLTTSQMYMSGTIRSWLHFIDVRDHEDAQQEVREIAQDIRAALTDELPAIFEAVEAA